MSSKKPIKQKAADPSEEVVIYKIMVAMIVVCIALIGVYWINSNYGVVRYTMTIYQGVLIGAIVFGAIAAVLLVAAAITRQRKMLCHGLLTGALIAALYALTSLALRIYVFSAALPLYCFWVAIGVLYAVWLLYQREFFLISLLTVAAGMLFLLAFRTYGGGMNTRLLLTVIVVIALAALICIATASASRHHGEISLGGRSIRIYIGTSPLLLYLTCTVWVLCTICVLLLGATFAYYCLFAAIAYELIAACYYTMKLR
jgi:hypothetical protein